MDSKDLKRSEANERIEKLNKKDLENIGLKAPKKE
jgi:hypothetical protein